MFNDSGGTGEKRMKLKTKLFGSVYQFKDVKEVLAKANEEKSGDSLAGIGAATTAERVAAKVVLSEMTLADLRNNPVIPYETDEVTRVIQDAVTADAYQTLQSMTVGEFREFILKSDGLSLAAVRDGLTAEMIAGVTKLMSNLDLVYAAKKLGVTATCNTTIGEAGTLSSRLQPNHPTDDLRGVMASVMEGISYGAGDAVIGLNPAIDSIDGISALLTQFKTFTNKWKIPTQNCVLAHVTTQMKALQQGAPMDLMFQSLAGSQKSNEAFGIDVNLLDDAYQLMQAHKSSTGPNFMYFETGQGSELSSGGHNGADQVTLEARCYGLAKRYRPFLVNTVVGFIGPEYLYDGRQMIRAGLEDHFMGKLTGLPMGVDVCYTNHMKADQNDLENLAMILAMGDCTYFMGIPCGDDIMLMYQTTSFHDMAALRELTGKRPIKEFAERMEDLGIMLAGRLTERAGDLSIFTV
ncbi:Ethanolamine ammonia-lyase heavy chain [Dendrosporobacter quercicolus]|uniref:Ethanolamine ammonia-lyase large subunit n=2 Tax=Dendrosporobacter quercicolus TaxID=146817 RepID=A0A1G9WAS2_9FIRM|nr:Ethanolamine ammonia-lyase heavy chain [Dendrosporobacter quercicolus]